MEVAATDLELSVIASTTDIEVERPGIAVFPGKELRDVVKTLPDAAEVFIEVDELKAKVKSARASWEFRLHKSTTYPALPTDAETFYEVPRDTFVSAVERVRNSASHDAVHPSLGMVSVKGGKMRAADGSRAAQVPVEGVPDLQIPIGAVDDLLRMLRLTAADTFEVATTENHIVFKIGDDRFIATRLAATFPDIDKALLKPALTNSDELEVDRDALLTALRRVSVTADAETNAVRLSVTKKTVSVRTKDKTGNTAEEVVDAIWKGSKTRAVAVNLTHLKDLVAMNTGQNVTLFFGEGSKTSPAPLLLREDTSIGVLNQIRVTL